jgi:hypothetical protein
MRSSTTLEEGARSSNIDLPKAASVGDEADKFTNLQRQFQTMDEQNPKKNN